MKAAVVAVSALLLVAVLVCAPASVEAASRCDWASQLLSRMGMGASSNRMTAMLGWMQGEGSPCYNNPLDTEENWSGASNCNGAGVKNYPSMDAGLSATIATIKNGYYGSVISAFANDEAPTSIAQAIASSPWGTKDAVSATQYCQSNYNACCSHGVVG